MLYTFLCVIQHTFLGVYLTLFPTNGAQSSIKTKT